MTGRRERGREGGREREREGKYVHVLYVFNLHKPITKNIYEALIIYMYAILLKIYPAMIRTANTCTVHNYVHIICTS